MGVRDRAIKSYPEHINERAVEDTIRDELLSFHVIKKLHINLFEGFIGNSSDTYLRAKYI